MATTNTAGEKTFTNSGKIYVSNGGYAIEGSSNGNGEISITNTGTIELADSDSTGIRLSDSTATSKVTIVNSNIISGNGTAISVENTQQNVNIKLSEGSQIDGVINLGYYYDKTQGIVFNEKVNASLDINGLQDQSLQLAGKASNLTLDSSSLIISSQRQNTYC